MYESPTLNSSMNSSTSFMLVIWWLVSSILILSSFLKGLSWLGPLGGLITIGYVIVLSRFMSKKDYLLPNIEHVVSPLTIMEDKFWKLTGILVLATLGIFIFGLMVGPAVGLLIILNLISFKIIKPRSSKFNRTILWFALSSSLFVLLSILVLGTHDVSWAVFMGLTTFNLSISGLLLQSEIPLTKIHVLEGRYSQSMKSFIWGCIYAFPLALLNILGKIYEEDTWISHWWQIFHALSASVGEEIWARLFLLPFLFIVALASTRNRYRRAILLAIIFSSIFHGFAHSGINPIGIIIGSLIYGIPIAYLYLKRDFEHTIGFHFFIDLIRFGAAYYLL